jgi:hypothetical protein
MCTRFALTAAVSLVLPALLAPEAPACAGRKVRVSVVVILATETENKVDPKLKCIADELKKRHPKLTGLRFATISHYSLAVGDKETFKLAEDQEAVVSVVRGEDKAGSVHLKVTPPAMGEITYSTPCGKFLPIVTRYRTKANELLIFAVRVQPCKGKKKER